MAVSKNSTWTEAKKKQEYPRLKQDLETEIVVIGAGLCGIITSYVLVMAGKKVVLIEAGKDILAQTTLQTTAFLTQSIDTELSQLNKTFGFKQARLVHQAHGQAIDLIESIIKKEKISCEFARCSNYTYASNNDEFEDLKTEFALAKKMDLPVRLGKKDLGFNHHGYLEFTRQAKFHPIKFAQSLADKVLDLGVKIYTNSKVEKISTGKTFIVKTKQADVKAKWIIQATYQPLDNAKTFAKKGMYKSYVLEAELPKNSVQEGTYEDLNNPYHYFRIDRKDKTDTIIFGGADHRSELKIDEKKNFKALEEKLSELFDQYKITRKWAGPILEASDGLALIGETKPRLLVASAFSGNGMTYSAIAAILLTDIIMGKKNPLQKLFDPKRVKAKALLYKAKDYTEEFFKGAVKNAG